MKDCQECDIVATKIAVLGGVTGGPGFVGRPQEILQLPDGRFVLADRNDQGHLKVYDHDGTFWRSVGRRGQGPGEYQIVQSLHLLENGGLEVSDLGQVRVTELDADFRVVHTFRIEVPGIWTAVLPDRSRVVVQLLPTKESAGLPLHWLDPSGKRRASFGADPPIEDVRDWDAHIRHIAPASDSSVWSAPYLEYALEEWSVTGHLLRRLDRDAAWFPRSSQGGFVSADIPPNPSNRAIHVDASGAVWVISWVADEHWRDALGTQEGPYGRAYQGYDTDDPSGYFDSVVEIIDPEKAQVVGRARLDEALLGFAGDGILFGYGVTEDGEPVIPIFKVGTPNPIQPPAF